MAAHGELAGDRPPPHGLTEFYLWTSAGGVIGGIFNALLAPVVFNQVTEYPITLVLACFLLPGRDRPGPEPLSWRSALPAPLTVGLLVILGTVAAGRVGQVGTPAGILAAYALPALLCFSVSRHPIRFGLGVAAFLLAAGWSGSVQPGQQGTQVFAERSFFGVTRVLFDPGRQQNTLFHGTTVHGAQKLDPARRMVPLAYYHPTGPIGQVFSALPRAGGVRSVAVVGLGAGSLACYAAPGQDWTFYEIDPVVMKVARDERFFTYLRDGAPQAAIKAGDARISLQRAPEGRFDFMIMDAYSSDAIPVHLLTREALQIYLGRLRAPGLLAFHISNRHFDLEPVLASLATDARLAALTSQQLSLTPEEAAAGKECSQWVILARDPATLDRLSLPEAWRPLRSRPGTSVWTDDFSSIITTLR